MNYHRINQTTFELTAIDFATDYFSSQKLEVLDIGSGLCVFLAKIKMLTDRIAPPNPMKVLQSC